MTLIERIRENDESLTDLHLVNSIQSYGCDIDRLVVALEGNRTVTSIRCDGDFLPSLPLSKETTALFTAMGRIKSLRELYICGGPVHICDIGKAIHHRTGLSVLYLGDVEIEGDQKSFKVFENALRQTSDLREFRLCDFVICDTRVCLDPMIKSLSLIHTLEIVHMETREGTNPYYFSSPALVPLCKASSLAELIIVGFDLAHIHLRLIATIIKQRSRLKVLNLSNVNMDDAGVDKIALAISGSASLEVVDLSSNKIGSRGCGALASALRCNSSVKFVNLIGNKMIGSAGYMSFASMLQSNATVERLDLPMTNEIVRIRIDEGLLRNRGRTKGMAMAA